MKKWLRSNEKAIYRVGNAVILAGTVLVGGQEFLGIGTLGRAHLLAALAMLAVCAALNFLAVRGKILCLAALLVFSLTGIAVAGMEESIRFLGSFFLWLSGRGAVPEAWGLWYGVIHAGLLTGICYLVQMLFEKVPVLKRAAVVLALLAMAFCLFARKELNHYGVAFLLVFCVMIWVEWIQSRWEKERSRGSREAHTFWIMPFLIIYLVLLAVMPAPEKPYDWLWAKNIYGQLRESFLTYTRNIKWGSQEGFGMAFSGFSEDGELGGEVQKESGQVMRIRVSRDVFGGSSADFSGNVVGNLYLTGNVYDAFDGRGWHQDWEGHVGEVFLDTAETLYAVRNYNEKYQRDYLREILLEIRYEDFNTGYVFAPLKAWGMEGSELPDYICRGGSLRWTRQQGYGTEYALRYFRMNVGQQEFDRFLEEAWKKEKNEETWAEVLRECERRNGEVFTWDDMMRYREEIFENYLGDIRLSSEVSWYLQEITEGAETDVEKLRAIERALRSFSYTLTPGELPDWVEEEGDFLDYFLLESRQGYCTYFATAFVLLARAEGIPARYVQGYCVPVPESGETYVDSSMAHAWPEVYLEGVGWIPFEPTPGYGGRRYSPWGLTQPDPGNLAAGQEGDLYPDDGADEGLKDGGNSSKTEEDGEEADGTETEEEENPSYLWKLLGMGIPLLLLVSAVVLALDHAIRRYRYKRMKLFEKFRMAVFRNLEILGYLGVKREEGETLQELRERAERLPELAGIETEAVQPKAALAEAASVETVLQKAVLTEAILLRKEMEGVLPEAVLPEAEGTGILGFMEDYERVIYGGEEVEEDMLEATVQAGERLLFLLKKEKKWAYFYCQMGLLLGRHR